MRKVRRGRGREKGGEFELYVCKQLSRWLGSERVIFWKSAGSGSVATVTKGLVPQYGDITSTHPDGIKLLSVVVISCKWYRQIDLLGHFDRKQSQKLLHAWWQEVLQWSRGCHRVPWLITKRNYGSPMLYTTPQLLEYCEVHPVLAILDADPPMYCVPFEKFLQEVEWNKVAEYQVSEEV